MGRSPSEPLGQLRSASLVLRRRLTGPELVLPLVPVPVPALARVPSSSVLWVLKINLPRGIS
jgi:hypothetical protein